MKTEGKVWINMTSSESQTGKSLKTIPGDLKIGEIPVIELVNRNKATILAVSYSSFSDSAIESFLALESSISYNIPKVIIQPILNPLKWVIWSRLLSKNPDCFVIRGDLPNAIETFGMENKYAGYIFLIDSSGIIRWKAAGPANEEELKQLQEEIKNLTD